jgi:hypothetical protein
LSRINCAWLAHEGFVLEYIVIKTMEMGRNGTNWAGDAEIIASLPAREGNDAIPSSSLTTCYTPTAATMLRLDEGVYALEIGEIAAARDRASGRLLPLMQVSAPPIGRHPGVEIIGRSAGRRSWLGPEGGTILIDSPPGGGSVLITTYGLPEQVTVPAHV